MQYIKFERKLINMAKKEPSEIIKKIANISPKTEDAATTLVESCQTAMNTNKEAYDAYRVASAINTQFVKALDDCKNSNAFIKELKKTHKSLSSFTGNELYEKAKKLLDDRYTFSNALKDAGINLRKHSPWKNKRKVNKDDAVMWTKFYEALNASGKASPELLEEFKPTQQAQQTAKEAN